MPHWRSANRPRLLAGIRPASAVRVPVVAALLAVLSWGCGDDDEVTYSQFNADDDSLTIQVGAAEILDAIAIDLHSTTGEVIIGTTTVTPGGGPIGTVHDIVVVIEDDYEDEVDRVSVRLDSGDRGEDEYDLEQDSADEGLFKLSIQSVGEEGEERGDSLTVRVWDEDEDSSGDTAG